MDKMYIGIDPGSKGFIVSHQDGIESFGPIPRIGNEYDNVALSQIFKQFKENSLNDIHVCLENVSPDPTWSGKTNWSLGGCISMFKQLFSDLEISYTMVTPRQWQNEMWQGVKKIYKPLTASQRRQKRVNGSVDTKQTSFIAARRLFPSVNFNVTSTGNKSKNYNDNLVDAKLICEYCKRKF